jgi:phospholipid/cholesterol/gamma-HCH transport system ATP-binding protein
LTENGLADAGFSTLDPEAETAPSRPPEARPPPMIRAEGLSKSFGDNQVLRGIDLDFPTGTTTVILGGSGSGKSVLMKHLIGLLEPDEGRVIVDGEDISKLDGEGLTALRAKFGMVFQWAALFDSMTVLDNVAFPLREHRKDLSEDQIREKVAEKLALFDLRGVEDQFPADLSGGMRKRVGLARAIIMDPKIVLYDEPTTGLDPITTDYVDEMIKQAKRSLGVTSVVISHDIASSFNIADYIAFLYGGKIVAYGPPEKVKESKHPFVERFLGTWFRKN